MTENLKVFLYSLSHCQEYIISFYSIYTITVTCETGNDHLSLNGNSVKIDIRPFGIMIAALLNSASLPAHAGPPNVASWLILHTDREESRDQSESLGNELDFNGSNVTVLAVPDSSH